MAAQRLPGYVVTLALGSMLIAGLAWYQIRREYRNSRAHWEAQLSTIADDRSSLVTEYLNDRRDDAVALASLLTFRSWPSREPPAGRVHLPHSPEQQVAAEFLDAFNAVYAYPGIYLFYPDGRILAHTTGAVELGAKGADICRVAAHEGGFQFAEMEGADGKILHCFTAPVFADASTRPANGGSRQIVGVVTILSDPARGLFPLLTAGTTTTRTRETLLLRREGNEAVYFSPLRHTSREPAATRRSPEAGLAAHAALEGREISGEFIDYRGVPVFGATRRIGMSGWGLVSKIDRDEALAGFRRTARLEAMLAGLLILALGGLLAGYERHRENRALRERIERQQHILNVKRDAQEIVDSIPAGLLVLAADLRVLSVNRTFLESFGLREEEVVGKPLPEVVRSEALPHRVTDVVHGRLTSHDVMLDVSVGGHEEKRPARISMADLVRMEEGTTRILLIIEDLTENERLRVAAEASEQRLRDLVQSLDAIVWEADPVTWRFSFVSQRTEEILGYPVERWLTEFGCWADHVHPEDRTHAVAFCQEATARGENHQFEYRALAVDGRVVWLRDIVRVLKDDAGRPVQLRGLMVDITHEREAQAAAREKDLLLRTVVDNAPLILFAIDKTGVFTLFEGKGLESLGVKPGQLVGQSIFEWAKDHPKALEAIQRTLAGEPITELREAGGLVVERTSVPVFDENGAVTGIVGFALDVTQRRRAEERVSEAEAKYRGLVESMPAVTYIAALDATGTTLYISPQISDWLGFPPAEWLADQDMYFRQVHPEDRERVQGEMARSRDQGEPFRCEYRMVARDGRVVWVHDEAAVMRDSTGQPRYIQGIMLDITTRKQAEEALHESRQFRDRVMESATNAIVALDLDARFTLVNRRLAEIAGYEVEELIGRPFTILVPPEDLERVRTAVTGAMREGVPVANDQAQILRKDGSRRIVSLSVAPLLVGETITGVVGTAEDITEGKRAEGALRQSEERFSKAFRASPAAMTISTLRDGRYLDANESFLKTMGYSRRELIGATSAQLEIWVNPDDRPRMAQMLQQQRSVRSFESRFRTKTGRVRDVLISAELIQLDGEECLLAITEDITEKKQVEAALRHSEERFRTQYKSFPVPTFTWRRVGDDFVLIESNDAAAEFTRGHAAQWVGNRASEMYHDRPDIVKDFWCCFRQQTPVSREMSYRFTATEEVRSLAVTYAPVPPDLVMVHAEDVTDRKQAEDALRESELRFRQLAENIGEVFYVRESRGTNVSYVSGAYEKIWGRNRESLYRNPLSWLDAVHPEHADRVVAAFQQSLQTGNFEEEYRIVQPDGSVRWIWDRASSVRDASGGTDRVVGVAQDITERKRAEQALRESEARLQALVGSIDEIVFESDEEGTYLNIWTANEGLLARPREELLGRRVGDVLGERFSRPFTDAYKRVVATGQAETLEYPLEVMSGKRWFSARISPIPSADGSYKTVRVSARDITEHKQAERVLRKSKERFRFLTRDIPGVVYLCRNDARYTMLYVSDAVERLTGYPKEDFLQNKVSFTDLYHPSDVDAIQREVRQAVAEQRPFHLPYRLKHRSGEWRWLEEIAVAIYQAKELMYWEGVLSDVTDRQRAKEADA